MRSKCFASLVLFCFLPVCAAWAKEKDAPPSENATAKPKTVTNSIGMKLVRIPAGEFQMGIQQSNEEFAKAFVGYSSYDPKTFAGTAIERERPSHRVRITKSFFLGACHVTVGEFRRFVSESGYRTDAEKGTELMVNGMNKGKGAFGWDAKTGDQDFRAEYSWRNPGIPQNDNHPVVCVSWNDATAFCQWLGRKEKKKYRLPTEAEWEYACRAGTTTQYWCGDDPEGLAKVANVADAAFKGRYPKEFVSQYAIRASDGYVFTSPVGSFRANPFGLYDMHGNAGQWCADWFDDKYYGKSPQKDPSGPDSGTSRVYRGGTWCSIAESLRSRRRGGAAPDFRTMGTGFRIAGDQIDGDKGE
jgi:formylglycine-generating enzyme